MFLLVLHIIQVWFGPIKVCFVSVQFFFLVHSVLYAHLSRQENWLSPWIPPSVVLHVCQFSIHAFFLGSGIRFAGCFLETFGVYRVKFERLSVDELVVDLLSLWYFCLQFFFFFRSWITRLKNKTRFCCITTYLGCKLSDITNQPALVKSLADFCVFVGSEHNQ